MIEGVNKKKKKVTSKFSSEVAADGSKVVHKKTSPGSTFVDVCAAVFAAACLILSFKTFQVWWIRTLYFSPELAVILSFALGCCAANLRLPTAGIAMQSFKVRSFGTSGPQDYMTRLNPCFWLQPTYLGSTYVKLQSCESSRTISVRTMSEPLQ